MSSDNLPVSAIRQIFQNKIDIQTILGIKPISTKKSKIHLVQNKLNTKVWRPNVYQASHQKMNPTFMNKELNHGAFLPRKLVPVGISRIPPKNMNIK